MKRVLVVVIIFAVAVGIVLAGFLLRGRDGQDQDGSGSGGALPIGGDGSFLPIGSGGGVGGTDPAQDQSGNLADEGSAAQINLVSLASVLDYAVNAVDGLLIMDVGGGVISFAGDTEEIIARANFGPIRGAWFSPDGEWLLVASGEDASARWSLLDISERAWRDIPANTDEVVWSPDSDRLAYLTARTSDSSLTLLDPASGNIQPILSLAAPGLSPSWRNADNIVLTTRPSSRTEGGIWNVAAAGGVLTASRVGVPGVHVLWDGTGERGLLFRSGPTGGVLELIDRNGTTGRAANFLTMPSKCMFGTSARPPSDQTTAPPELEDYVFCAIPRDTNVLRNAELPDDYLKRKFSTSDALYAIDLVTGAILPVTASSQTFFFDAANLKIYGNELYFTDRNTRYLYRVSISVITGILEEGEEAGVENL